MLSPFTQKLIPRLLILLTLLCVSGPITAAEIRVAVASNFSQAFKDISQLFLNKTGHRVIPIFGSSGKHYAQILNGAPFDAFFSADSKRAKLLAEKSIALRDSRFTYAIGKLVLWSPLPGIVDKDGHVLTQGKFRFLAMANPKLAPYGYAAQQVINARAARDRLQGRLVRGENIGQTFQFVKSGNAELGFVAASQIKRPGSVVAGSYWQPPQSLYNPIEQQAVLLTDNKTAHEFTQFVQSPEARQIMLGYGYAVP